MSAEARANLERSALRGIGSRRGCRQRRRRQPDPGDGSPIGLRGAACEMFHAVSPAVPQEATQRVQALADARRLELTVIDAGEFDDRRLSQQPGQPLLLLQDQSVWRARAAYRARRSSPAPISTISANTGPVWIAAKDHGVRHPFVEAGIDKKTVRAHSAPSRTGRHRRTARGALPVEPHRNRHRHRSRPCSSWCTRPNGWYRSALAPRTVRCRVRAKGVVIELDEQQPRRARRHRARCIAIGASRPPVPRGRFRLSRFAGALSHRQRIPGQGRRWREVGE